MYKTIIRSGCVLYLFTMVSMQTLFAQNTDSLHYKKNYTNLDEAFLNPELVYRLDLSNQLLNNGQIESLSKFRNLSFLSLRNDHLKEIPKSIVSLKNLKSLDLSGNDFKFLPAGLKKLKNLEEIYLNDESNADINQEVRILSKLPNLRILHLENDSLKIIPKSITSLKNLEKLYLNGNSITELPDFISRNKKLLYIDMKSNPLQWRGERPFGITINF